MKLKTCLLFLAIATTLKHGRTLDPAHHRAFLVCEENNLMTMFDLDRHEPIAYLELAGGLDVIKFDSGLGRIYAGCYSGA